MKKAKKSNAYKKFAKWRKYALVPVALALLALPLAWNKKHLFITAQSAPTEPRAARAVSSEDFDRWCHTNMGEMIESGNICQFKATTALGDRMLNFVDSWWNSGVTVAVGDTVRVQVKGYPKMRLGMEILPDVTSMAFVARSNGPILFSSRDLRSGFVVEKIQLLRCFDSSRQTVPCRS